MFEVTNLQHIFRFCFNCLKRSFYSFHSVVNFSLLCKKQQEPTKMTIKILTIACFWFATIVIDDWKKIIFAIQKFIVKIIWTAFELGCWSTVLQIKSMLILHMQLNPMKMFILCAISDSLARRLKTATHGTYHAWRHVVNGCNPGQWARAKDQFSKIDTGQQRSVHHEAHWNNLSEKGEWQPSMHNKKQFETMVFHLHAGKYVFSFQELFEI